MISPAVIASANTRSVSDAAVALPSVHTTILGWFRPLVLGRITKKIVDGETFESIKEQRCMGVIQLLGRGRRGSISASAY